MEEKQFTFVFFFFLSPLSFDSLESLIINSKTFNKLMKHIEQKSRILWLFFHKLLSRVSCDHRWRFAVHSPVSFMLRRLS